MIAFKKINGNLIGYILGVALILGLFVVFIFGTQIGHEVRKNCAFAQARYGGACVEALMKQVEDESTVVGKNDAIWSLGQLGDKTALPLLKKYDNGLPLPAREPWNEGISQYELRKAIKLLKADFNLLAWSWRS